MISFRTKPLSSLLILAYSLLLLDSAFGDDPISLEPVYSNCSGGSYVPNSPFQTNLNLLLSSLASNSSSSNFYNTTAGAGADRAYGLYLCQGDLSHADCKSCISSAADSVLTKCPARRQALIWYDYCVLRYSDRDFFGVMDSNGIAGFNPTKLSTAAKPLEFISNLVKKAPFQRPLMFAANASLRHSMFAMAECTMDISSQDCSKCLNKILGNIKDCCSQNQGWRYLAPSCSIRYEATPFLRNLNLTSFQLVLNQCSKEEIPAGSAKLRANLDSLLSSLPAQARPTGFHNSTVGDEVDRLYGLALCRGDIAPGSEACQDCLTDAAQDVAWDCPNKTQGIVWYEKCLLRYSNKDFFGVADDTAGEEMLCNPQQMSETDGATVLGMIQELIDNASVEVSMFAAGEKALSNFTGYGLVQCTKDLSDDKCTGCLSQGKSKMAAKCNQSEGWRYLSGSCTLRFETNAFFNTSVLSEAPAPASPDQETPPPSPASRDQETPPPSPASRDQGTLPPSPVVKGAGHRFGPEFLKLALFTLLVMGLVNVIGNQ